MKVISEELQELQRLASILTKATHSYRNALEHVKDFSDTEHGPNYQIMAKDLLEAIGGMVKNMQAIKIPADI